MQWPLIIGSAALSVWLIGTIVRIFDRQFEIVEQSKNGQLRLLYSLLRLMESSPPGLIGTKLKLQFCRYISLAFSELQAKHGANAGYRACVDTAEAQIEILKGRAAQDHLPRFQDAERISEGHKALPRFQAIVEQLEQMNVISAEDSQQFALELRDRQFELEADTCLLRAERAAKLNDPMSAQRHFMSAQMSLRQLKSATVKNVRLAQLEQSLAAFQR
ncbi:MAG: hypothetical protein AB8B86_00680 [Pseudomonadales bacterium]